MRQLLESGPLIARGNGRSYGDSALNPHLTVSMARFNRMLEFDTVSGFLTVEAGVHLEDIIKAFLPRGWFPAVTPGTKFVTVGGMLAADVHGKNHHKDGSIARQVAWIELMTAGGTVVRCSPEENEELFRYTLGGMGLTGIILRAAFRLIPVESGWILQRTVAAPNLDAALDELRAASHHTYTVAWIDCLARGPGMGRSLIQSGEHAALANLPVSLRGDPFVVPRRPRLPVPMDLPQATLNRLTMRAFNAFYYHQAKRRPAERLVDWDGYFYPLDAVGNWNRLYGRKGLAQFQCVLPEQSAQHGLTEILERVSAHGSASFLAVLKLLGSEQGGVSFPMQGYTLALDFPVNEENLTLMEHLDAIVVAHGGRFYLAKDARMGRDIFEKSDDRIHGFREFRTRHRLGCHFASVQAERLAL